jgi:hypothetical protein
MTCLPPDVVKEAGHPTKKHLRLGQSRFSKPEDSTIICGECGMRGHNKRTCNIRQMLANKESMLDVTKESISNIDNIILPPPDIL